MYYEGALNRSVLAMVLDGGFQNYLDTPPGSYFIDNASAWTPSPIPIAEPNPYRCSDGSDCCTWHGVEVSDVLAGVADNEWGAAGPGGPVTQLAMVQQPSPDFFSFVAETVGIVQALAIGPRMLNMSFGGSIPAALAPVPEAVTDAVTGALREGGVLLFASAGNAHVDVDQQDFLFGRPIGRSNFFVPCRTWESSASVEWERT